MFIFMHMTALSGILEATAVVLSVVLEVKQSQTLVLVLKQPNQQRN